MRVVLLRHGTTDRNSSDRFQAQSDIPLNTAGMQQAQGAVRALTQSGWAAVYSSPLFRATHTAAYAAGRFDVPHYLVEGLRERHLGTLDGQHRADFARRHPDTMRRLLTDPEYAPPGGESGNAALARFSAALHHIIAAHATDELVLVVAHGGVLRLLSRALAVGCAELPDIMVGTCRAVCLDTRRSAEGAPRVALRWWNAAPQDCAEPRQSPDTLPFISLDDFSVKGAPLT